jgi:hypothetical protein
MLNISLGSEEKKIVKLIAKKHETPELQEIASFMHPIAPMLNFLVSWIYGFGNIRISGKK